MNKPLANVTVIALEQAVAAPYCTARLADAGARVIKIERTEGDFARAYDDAVHGESSYFVWLNRGKQSIAVDIKDPQDVALLGRMVAAADVFVQNLAPGAAQRAGFGSAQLRAAHPRLITCDITGYGEEGPYRDMKAYDLLVQCESGLASITGTPDAPGRVGVSAADLCCGMNAHAAILQALYDRERTGRGSGLSVSLFDALADWMAVPLLHHDYAGRAPVRMGLAHPSIAPYGEYKLRNGRSTVIAIQNPREWAALCNMLKRPRLIDDPRFASNVARCAHRTELDREISAALGEFDADQLSESLKGAGVAFGFVNSVAEFSAHPQLRRVTVDTPSGPARMPAPPVRWADPPGLLGEVPAIDADGAALRREFA
jgi:itaconate CoA-transferase